MNHAAVSSLRWRLLGLIAVAVALAVALLIWVLAVKRLTDPGPAPTEQAYNKVTLGSARSRVLLTMGVPARTVVDYVPEQLIFGTDFGAPPSGTTTCDYYSEADSMQDPGVMRLCYDGENLVQKSSYGLA